MLDVAWLIPLFPLAGFALLVAFGRRFGEPVAGWVATIASAASFVTTALVFFALTGEPHNERFHINRLFTWISSGSFEVDIGLLVDPLSITMCLFITGVGTLIHLYAIGYMHGDRNFSKFFVYLNLFIASMLLLVLGDNLLLTFLGWEGVGACSYLLISFWFDDEVNASAGKKAFVTNRIGDFGFMLAAFLIFTKIGSINYDDIIANADKLGTQTATIIVVLLLLGAAGKSAQIPLFVWLPDAMAGPTPVSALIHAATMVTSGVFLLIRLSPVLAEAETWTGALISWVGAITALVAATIALAQNDIKKVLAYSTVSQLGYMFLAIGVGGYVAAIFHMVTHALFKALLFLGSGSVIHGLHDEQDMRRMGGLQKFMPVTAFTFIIGWLAIAGVPPFSGFWSKDEILAYAWNADSVGGKGLWAIGIITALLTAFYMTRQVILTFFGRTRFYDATSAEIEQAWQAKVEAANAEVGTAQAAIDKLEEDRSKALADVEKKNAALTKATTGLDEAEVAMAASSPETDGYDKLEKALAKATKAVPKAEAALVKSEDKVSTMAAQSVDLDRQLVSYQAEVLQVENQQGIAGGPAEFVTAATDPADSSALDGFMPQSYIDRQETEPHESPATMTFPLIVLAALAFVAGAINLPFTKSLHFLGHWLEPSLFGNEAHLKQSASTLWLLALLAICCAAVAIFMAFSVYLRGRGNPASIEKTMFSRGWYINETYADFFGGPGRLFFSAIAWFDRTIVDGAINGISTSLSAVSGALRGFQPGLVRSYAVGISAGSVLVMVWFLLRLA